MYAYGLIESEHVTIPAGLSGIGGEAIRIEPIGAFRAIVSDFHLAALRPDRENILAHERVLEAVLDRITPLPFRFGAVVTHEQLLKFVEQHAPTVAADLKRVRGCVQMSVKLI